MRFRETLKINDEGHLEIGGVDAVVLAQKYGTPLYVLDEDYVRSMCRKFVSSIPQGIQATILYASKALSTMAIYRIVESEGLGADVVSGGELYTAMSAGMDPKRVYFHGNNKTENELRMALSYGIRCIVADNLYDIERLEQLGDELKISGIGVQMRVNPGVEAHTHHYLQTSKSDSKFGLAISDGSASEAVKEITKSKNLKFLGLHCHIGSQIFDVKPYGLAIEKLTDFIKLISDEYGAKVSELNLGGGFGIYYTAGDTPPDPGQFVRFAAETLKGQVNAKGLDMPRLIFEPGRSIVGEAGVTLYTVGSIKQNGQKKYVAVDGGMFDNPRYALYQAKYSALLANRADEPNEETVTIAGKCCESGDIIISEIELPRAKAGDILAVFSTGAYNYSMASNYNRNPVPPMVLVRGGKSEYIVRPQTYEDIISRDVIPESLK